MTATPSLSLCEGTHQLPYATERLALGEERGCRCLVACVLGTPSSQAAAASLFSCRDVALQHMHCICTVLFLLLGDHCHRVRLQHDLCVGVLTAVPLEADLPLLQSAGVQEPRATAQVMDLVYGRTLVESCSS